MTAGTPCKTLDSPRTETCSSSFPPGSGHKGGQLSSPVASPVSLNDRLRHAWLAELLGTVFRVVLHRF